MAAFAVLVRGARRSFAFEVGAPLDPDSNSSRVDAVAFSGPLDRFLELIRTKCEMLAQHPLAGEARPELGANLRAFPVGNYIIFYRPDSDGIEVVRVLHGARDIPKQF